MPDIAPLASADEAGLEDYRNRATRLLCSAGLAGLPQLSLPKLSSSGLTIQRLVPIPSAEIMAFL